MAVYSCKLSDRTSKPDSRQLVKRWTIIHCNGTSYLENFAIQESHDIRLKSCDIVVINNRLAFKFNICKI